MKNIRKNKSAFKALNKVVWKMLMRLEKYMGGVFGGLIGLVSTLVM